jgi:serine/threonine-protein kinase RsbW
MPSTLNRDKHERPSGPPRLQVVLESSMPSINEAASLVIRFAKKYRYGKQQCHEIELAVREAVANAVLHGNRCDAGKKVFLTAAMQPSGLVVCVRDEGKGFDPESVRDPLVPGNLMQESGRGLFLVRAYMDEVIWRRAAEGGMEIWLTKYPAKRP